MRDQRVMWGLQAETPACAEVQRRGTRGPSVGPGDRVGSEEEVKSQRPQLKLGRLGFSLLARGSPRRVWLLACWELCA